MTETSATWFRRGAGTLAAVALAFALYCGWALVHYGADSRDFGWSFAVRADGTYVGSVNPAGPASAALRTGDRVLAIDGSESLIKIGPALAVRAIGATGKYQVRIRRQGPNQQIEERDVPLQLANH